MAYSDKVVDHYENPRNVGSFAKGDETVGTGMSGRDTGAVTKKRSDAQRCFGIDASSRHLWSSY